MKNSQLNPQKQFENWFLISLIALSFGLRSFQLGKQSLWFDDIITIHLAKLPLLIGIDGLLNQGIQLTPQYHWITKIWLFVGDSEWVLRFPALSFSVLTIPFIFQLGKLYFGRQVGLLAALIFTLNPYQIWYAQEVKVYSLLTLAAVGSMHAFVRLLRGGGQKTTIQLIIFNMLGFGSHYFMFLLPTVQFIFILLHFKTYYVYFRKWLLINIVSASILLPWFGYIIFRQQFTTGIGWIARPILLDPLLTIWNFTISYQEEFTSATVISFLIVLLVLIIGIIKIQPFKPLSQLVLIWLFFHLIIVWIFSQGTTSFYVDRYFLVITPALTLLLSIGVTTITNQKLKVGLGLFLLLATTYGLSQVYFNRTHFTRDDWRTMVHHVNQKVQPGDGLVTCADGERLALDYYGLDELFTNQTQEKYFVYPAMFDFNRVLAKYKRLWVVITNPRKPAHHLGYSYPPILDPKHLPTPEQTWLAQNPPQVINVPGITAFIYALDKLPDLNALIRWNCQTKYDGI